MAARKRQRGTITIEIVLLAPLLLVLAFLTFEFGRVFGSWVIITNAAREGARFGITQVFSTTDQCGTSCSSTDAAIQSRVAQTANPLSVQQVACQSNNRPPNGSTSCIGIMRATDASGEDQLTVLVAFQIQALMPISGRIPFVGAINYPGVFTVSAVTTMRAE